MDFMNRRDGAPVLLGGEACTLERIPLDGSSGTSFSEGWLQLLLAEHPECLPLADIEPGLDSLVSICREVPTEHGPIGARPPSACSPPAMGSLGSPAAPLSVCSTTTQFSL